MFLSMLQVLQVALITFLTMSLPRRTMACPVVFLALTLYSLTKYIPFIEGHREGGKEEHPYSIISAV